MFNRGNETVRPNRRGHGQPTNELSASSIDIWVDCGGVLFQHWS